MHNQHDKKLYGTATIGSKGQIVIPSDAREELGLQPGDRLYIAGSSSKKVLFCVKEDQFEHLLQKLTGDDEKNVKQQLEDINKKG